MVGQIGGDGTQVQIQGGQKLRVLLVLLLGLFFLDLLLDVGLLGGQILDLLGQLVDLQLLLVDGQAQGVGVVLKELLVDPDGVACGHIQLLDLLVGVPGDLHGVFSRVAVEAQEAADRVEGSRADGQRQVFLDVGHGVAAGLRDGKGVLPVEGDDFEVAIFFEFADGVHRLKIVGEFLVGDDIGDDAHRYRLFLLLEQVEDEELDVRL